MNIAIIGAGKVGTALAFAFRKAGFSLVAVASRRQESLDTAMRYIGTGPVYTLDDSIAAKMADVIGVATQDREIAHVADFLCRKGNRWDGKIFFHTSGAHASSELSPLDRAGGFLGSLHPLGTFPDIDAGIAALPETYIFIEGDDRALPVLKLLGGAVGVESVPIEGAHKVLYHLSAVFVCNLLAALFFSGEAIMEKIDIGLKPFLPIIKSTLRNIESKGPLLALTGPVVRGDRDTVDAHLRAIRGMGLHERVYRDLSLVALEMATERGTLTEEQRAALRRLLEDKT